MSSLHIKMKTNIILQGDSLTQLKILPDESIDCVMTSPPYWALRDYGVEGQLGLEPTFEEYINKLCDIFDEIKRVLKKTGTCWVNLGDTYGGSKGGGPDSLEREKEDKSWEDKSKKFITRPPKANVPDKSLCLIPMRFAIEMVNRGWILRNNIIWHKRNCMPSSASDRFTVDFEYLFFFTKNKKYFFETQLEQLAELTKKDSRFGKELLLSKNIKKGYEESKQQNPKEIRQNYFSKGLQEGRNKRTVWTINPKPYKEAHFATYPEELCETPIKAGCPIEGIVLDPFFGSGTTGVVALKQQKKFIGIELNQKYIEIANKRLKPYLEQRKL